MEESRLRHKTGHRRNRTQFDFKRTLPPPIQTQNTLKPTLNFDEHQVITILSREKQKENSKKVVVEKLQDHSSNSFFGPFNFGRNAKIYEENVLPASNPKGQVKLGQGLFQIRQVNDVLTSQDYTHTQPIEQSIDSMYKTKVRPILEGKQNIPVNIFESQLTRKHRQTSSKRDNKDEQRIRQMEIKLKEITQFSSKLEKRNVMITEQLKKLQSQQTLQFKNILQNRYKLAQIQEILKKNREKIDQATNKSWRGSMEHKPSKAKKSYQQKMKIVDPGLFTQQIFKRKKVNQETAKKYN